MRLIERRRIQFIMAVVIIVGATFIPVYAAAAVPTYPSLDNTYLNPGAARGDPDNPSKFGDPNPWLNSVRTQYVRRSGTRLAAWYPNSTGNTLSIRHAHYCSNYNNDFTEAEDYWGQHPKKKGSNITKYTVNGVDYYGKYYTGANDECKGGKAARHINIALPALPASSLENGYYRVDINVTIVAPDKTAHATHNVAWRQPHSKYPGLHNSYRIVASGGALVGSKGVNPGAQSNGHTATMGRAESTPLYNDYFIDFGTRCNMAGASEDAWLSFYDLDNAGGAGAQPSGGGPVTVRLRDVTLKKNIDLNGAKAGVAWEPAHKDNVNQSKKFTAERDHKYRLVIQHAYFNNTIQYGLPYSQINALDCASTAMITPSASVTSETIDGDAGGWVTFENQVATSGLRNVGTDGFDYDITRSSGGGGGATWGSGSTADDSDIGLSPAGDRIPSAKESAKFTVDPSSGALAGNKYCRTVTVSGEPGYVTFPDVNGSGNEDAADKTREACVTITGTNITVENSVAESNSTVDSNGNEHEKGEGNKIVTHTVKSGSVICDASGNNHVVSIYSSVNGGAETDVGTITLADCVALALDTDIGTTNILASTLDLEDVGVNYSYSTIARNASGVELDTEPGSILVVEVPFARFFGNDVNVCGDALINRFARDDRKKGAAPGITIHREGSLSEYGSFFNSDNTVIRGGGVNWTPASANKYAGLMSNGGEGYDVFHPVQSADWWKRLRSDWDDTSRCSSGIAQDDIVVIDPVTGNVAIDPISGDELTALTGDKTLTGGSYDSTVISYEGDVTISGNIYRNNSSLPADYSVIIIKAANIDIENTVTQIDAILITDGVINTCSNVSDANKLHLSVGLGGCDYPLKINGAVYADKLLLRRTGGTRYLADLHTTKIVTPGSNSTASEIIEYPWQLNFANPDLSPNSNDSYDAYFAKPPRL